MEPAGLISFPPGPPTFGDALGPPTEACGGPDEVGRRWSAAHQANWTSSRSSMVATYWLMTALLVSGHRCSTGNNSSTRRHTASVTSVAERSGALAMPHPIKDCRSPPLGWQTGAHSG